jgi:hypothetical protein
MITRLDIHTLFEPLVTAYAIFEQNGVTAKLASAIFLTLCRSHSALSFVK